MSIILVNSTITRPGLKVIILINFEPFMGLKIGLTLREVGGNCSPPHINSRVKIFEDRQKFLTVHRVVVNF